MAQRKTAGQWQTFRRWLARTGNARLAARQAGMNVGTAYDRRAVDDAFAAKWAAALAEAKANPPSRKASADKGPGLVVRKTKRGDQLVAAAPGRWSARREAVFFAELRRTGNVRRAAAACGLSTSALYYRRNRYPDFAAGWARMLEEARQRIPELLDAAAIASLDPEAADPDLPPVDVKDAIAICRMRGWGASPSPGPGGRRGRIVRPEPTIEEVRDEILRRLAAIRRHRNGEDGGE
ncbi:MAG TPA: hypothetical protein VGW40_15210 [Allosphingosinicella sp.]|nr:hypothetical protein [Allosphingosinicella sp.]